MATIRLTPSTYYLSNSSYLSVTNADNMYNNTDNDTYARVYNSRSSTSNYYIYLRGFNFDDLPSAAIVSSFEIKLKAYETGVSTSYYPQLCDGTTTINGQTTALGTSVTTKTFTNVTQDWETIVGYGSDFGIRINCRRASRNTASYVYIYGAEIEVNYTLQVAATVTSSLTGNGTINPSGAYNCYEGDEYTLTITPTDLTDLVTITKDGVDVTSDLVAHGSGSTTTLTASDYSTSEIQSGSSYASYCIGYTAENPNSSAEDSNMYASSNSTGYAEYSFDFSDIPSNAVIENVEVKCRGHRESSTISSTYVSQCILYRGETAISEEVDFPSTYSTEITITPTDIPTRTELNDVVLRHYVGYYGGLVEGISFLVAYSMGTNVDHYTYTYIVDGDATILVKIGPLETNKVFLKINGSWVEAAAVYKKVNGSWVEQSDLTTIFDSNTNYIKEN